MANKKDERGLKSEESKSPDIEAIDEKGVPWKNRAMEYKRKLDEISTKGNQLKKGGKVMNRDELIEQVKEECPLDTDVNVLITRAITEDEEIFGKYLEYKEVKAPEGKGMTTNNYDYYIVTDRKFVRIFTSNKECWYKVCPLDRFMGLEEKFLNAESQELNVHFDVSDKELRQIKIKIERTDKHREKKENRIEKFMPALMKAVSK